MQIMTTRFDGKKPITERIDLDVNPAMHGEDLYRDVLEAAKEHKIDSARLLNELTSFKDPHDGITVHLGDRVEEKNGKYYVHRDDMAAHADVTPPVSLLNPGDYAMDIKGVVLPMGDPAMRPAPPPERVPPGPKKTGMTRGQFITAGAATLLGTTGIAAWLLRGSSNDVNHTTFDIPQEHGKYGSTQHNNLIREESTQLSEAQKPLYAKLHRLITDGGNPEQLAELKKFLTEDLAAAQDKDQSISHNVIAKAVAYILATSVGKSHPRSTDQLDESEKHAVEVLDTIIMNMPDEPKDITFITDGKTRKGMGQLAADGWIQNTKIADEYKIEPSHMVADAITSSIQQRAAELELFKGQHAAPPHRGANVEQAPVTTISHP